MICSGDREPKARSLAESRRTGGWITNPSTESTGFDPPHPPSLRQTPSPPNKPHISPQHLLSQHSSLSNTS